MTFNGPPEPTHEKLPAVETPEYWKDNPPFKSPKEYFKLQYEFAKIMAERNGISLTDAIAEYAPIMQKALHKLDANGKELADPIEGLTEESLFEAGYEMAQERRREAKEKDEHTPYHDEKGLRFGCHSYDYDESTKTVRVHFFNAEAEEEWEDGKDVAKGPLSKEKIDRRRHELAEMFKDIKARHPEAEHVHGRSNLYNLEAYRRLYPESYEVGDVDYSPELWKQGMGIWGQFLGGNEKAEGEYGFKRELAEEFLEKAKTTPLDALADALAYPPRTADGPIQDFYDLYGIK